MHLYVPNVSVIIVTTKCATSITNLQISMANLRKYSEVCKPLHCYPYINFIFAMSSLLFLYPPHIFYIIGPIFACFFDEK